MYSHPCPLDTEQCGFRYSVLEFHARSEYHFAVHIFRKTFVFQVENIVRVMRKWAKDNRVPVWKNANNVFVGIKLFYQTDFLRRLWGEKQMIGKSQGKLDLICFSCLRLKVKGLNSCEECDSFLLWLPQKQVESHNTKWPSTIDHVCNRQHFLKENPSLTTDIIIVDYQDQYSI